MPTPPSGTYEGYRRAELRLRELLFGDESSVPGVIRGGEDARLRARAELRRMRQAVDELVAAQEEASVARPEDVDLAEELRRVASARSEGSDPMLLRPAEAACALALAALRLLSAAAGDKRRQTARSLLIGVRSVLIVLGARLALFARLVVPLFARLVVPRLPSLVVPLLPRLVIPRLPRLMVPLFAGLMVPLFAGLVIAVFARLVIAPLLTAVAALAIRLRRLLLRIPAAVRLLAVEAVGLAFVAVLVALFVARFVIGADETGLTLRILRLGRGEDAIIMLGVLKIVFRRNRIARRRRIARQLDVFVGDVGRGAADFYIRSIRLITPAEWVRAFAVVIVTTAHALLLLMLLLTLPHGSRIFA